MTPEEKYELFEQKINGKLTVEQESELSALLDNDESVVEEFRVYASWNSYLDKTLSAKDETLDLENNLKKIGSEFFDKKETTKETKVIKLPFWLYAVAASITILAGVYTFMNSTPSYNDFAVIPTLSITERGAPIHDYKKVEVAFNSKNYKEAEKYLSELAQENQGNSEFNFYYGIVLLEQNKYSQATSVFQKIQKSTSIYKYRSLWFEALNQLKQQKKEKCMLLLEKIPKDAEDYTKAQELLGRL